LKALAEENDIVFLGRVEVFVFALEDSRAVAEQLAGLAIKETTGADAVDLMAASDELRGNAAGAATNIKNIVQAERNVFEQEAAVFFLSAGQIANCVFDSIRPVSVVKIARANKMTTSEESSDEANLLPGVTLLAPHGLRTDEKGHRW
jgi:hypothetical protein